MQAKQVYLYSPKASVEWRGGYIDIHLQGLDTDRTETICLNNCTTSLRASGWTSEPTWEGVLAQIKLTSTSTDLYTPSKTYILLPQQITAGFPPLPLSLYLSLSPI